MTHVLKFKYVKHENVKYGITIEWGSKLGQS